MMLYNHLIFCHNLFHLPSVCPSIRVFSNESALLIRNSGLALRLSSGSDPRRPQRAPAELPVPLSALCHPHPQSPHHTAQPSESRHIGNSHKAHEGPLTGVQARPTRKVKVLVTQSDSF